MTSIIVLQARLDSTRLPGKALLCIGGMPMAVLAARRAANTGRKLLVATSNDSCDDALANTLSDYKIQVYRGNHNNTLQRFVRALANYDNNTRVIRITGDNPFPDGEFLDVIEEEFIEKDLRYLTSTGRGSGLPYGVSAEIMYLRDLRDANTVVVSDFEKEHVTPWLREKYGIYILSKYASIGMENYRATIDVFDDYVSVHAVFDKVVDPVNEPLKTLLKRLRNAPHQPTTNASAVKLILGGAQFGMAYGINNKSGKPSQEFTDKLIRKAIVNGVQYIDTARDYGDSESMVGHALRQGWKSRVKVITKLSPLQNVPDDSLPESLHAFVEASVYGSCRDLNIRTLDILLLHRESHRTAWNGEVWQKLLSLKRQGVINALGVSVQKPEELEACLSDPDVSLIQVPFNILDHRWESMVPEILEKRKERGLVVHSRSAFLQGLLMTDDPDIWRRAGEENPGRILDWLEEARLVSQCASRAQLCLLFCLTQEWIDGVVVGMEREDQLEENLSIASAGPLTLNSLRVISERPVVKESVLDPSAWQ